ncbi:hypothetical protein MXB_1030 [Myxobolus squamalis]|nr:hypothetical protein MXB_1030 [Myxobolus squamalis]
MRQHFYYDKKIEKRDRIVILKDGHVCVFKLTDISHEKITFSSITTEIDLNNKTEAKKIDIINDRLYAEYATYTFNHLVCQSLKDILSISNEYDLIKHHRGHGYYQSVTLEVDIVTKKINHDFFEEIITEIMKMAKEMNKMRSCLKIRKLNLFSRLSADDVDHEDFNRRIFYNFILFIMIKMTKKSNYCLSKDINYLMNAESGIIITYLFIVN